MKAGDPIVWTIRGYQKLISANLPPTCRFEPSCSQYTATAIRVHGPGRGLAMGAWRILRCNPFHPGGYDPVPDAMPQVGDDAASGDGHG